MCRVFQAMITTTAATVVTLHRFTRKTIMLFKTWSTVVVATRSDEKEEGDKSCEILV